MTIQATATTFVLVDTPPAPDPAGREEGAGESAGEKVMTHAMRCSIVAGAS